MSLTVLITGANRGIGLGLTQKFLREGHTVIATTRNPDGSRELWEVESHYGKQRCQIIDLDVQDERSIKAAAAELGDVAIDMLINNAGIAAKIDAAFDTVNQEDLTKAFTVNAIGPLFTTRAFLTHLHRGKRKVVATISSRMGSINDNNSGGAYAYRMSKAAVNMFTRSLAMDNRDLVAVVLHPGWVKTDMGGAGATLSVEDSVNGIYEVLMGLKAEHTGRFFKYNGEELPW